MGRMNSVKCGMVYYLCLFRRAVQYFTRLYKKYSLPVDPIVIVSYDAPLREEPTSHRVVFSDRTVLHFTYCVI